MRSRSILVMVMFVCVMAVANIASADMVQGINIDFVTIGNPGNPGDTKVQADPCGCGAVSYNYRIGKYEVTNAQWNAFIAAAGAPTGNPSTAYDSSAYFTGAQQPTNCVSWYEAAQFCNYLTSGDKSKGAYQFSGNNTNPGDFQGINRTAAISSYGIAYVIPTENEWYKAAFHKNDGVTGNYWLYPTQSNSEPNNDLINPDPGNSANYYQDDFTTNPEGPTAVGEFENSDSNYGTFDQGGNVFEWNESLESSYRGCRGGAYCYTPSTTLYHSNHWPPYYERDFIGFRVAEVNEPHCSQSIPGDVNLDCKLDFTDFAIIAAHWLECNLQPQSACWQ